MKRVAADENLHYLFYRDLVTAAIELDPSAMMIAIERQIRTFQMPGTGIPGFGPTPTRSPPLASTTCKSTTIRSSSTPCSATGTSTSSTASTQWPSAPGSRLSLPSLASAEHADRALQAHNRSHAASPTSNAIPAGTF